MVSLNVENVFTDISLEETIKICCDSLYKNQELLPNISKNQFEKLSRAALSNNYFLFDDIIYLQADRVIMSFSLVPGLANAFLVHYIIKKFGLVFVRMSLSLCIIKHAWKVLLK